MSGIGVIDFKITYGTNPPSVTITFPRRGLIDGESFVFYSYEAATAFVHAFGDARHAAFGIRDSIGNIYRVQEKP